jgi:hypothetical protein
VFGDFDDPDSEVSRLVRERNGFQPMAELGYNPVNHYLPPRHKPQVATTPGTPLPSLTERFKRWLDKTVVR